MKRKITVYVDGFPEGTDDEEIASFVTDALGSWGGQFDPEDPLFHSLEVLGVKIGEITYER